MKFKDIDRRLGRLEHSRNGDGCEECCDLRDEDEPAVTYVVSWDHQDPYAGEEHCPKCGRQLSFVVTWADA